MGENIHSLNTIKYKYYAYRATTSLGLVVPIIFLYLQRNISFGVIGLLESILLASTILFEVPTGYVADRIGRRESLIFSNTMFFIVMFIFTFSSNVLYLGVVYLLWAAAESLRSGTADAWLYEVLDQRSASDEFARIHGRGTSFYLLVTGGLSVLAGYVAEIDIAYPFIGASALSLCGVGILLTFPGSNDTKTENQTFTMMEAIPVVRRKFTEPPLRSFVLYVALFYAIVKMTNIFIQPISTSIGLEVRHLGWIYAAFTGFSSVVTYLTGTIQKKIGLRNWLFLLLPAICLCFLAIRISPLVAIPVFFVMRAAVRVTRPMANQYINDHTGSLGRATVLSTAALVYSIVLIPFQLAGGFFADLFSPITVVAIAGGVVFALLVVMRVMDPIRFVEG